MASNDILSEFSSADISMFQKDFAQLIRVGAELDRYYGESNNDFDSLNPKFEKLVELFNKKYKGIKLKTKKTLEHFKVRVFIKSRNIRDFFADSASRIPGLKAVGRTSFNQIEVSDVEKFTRFLDLMLDSVYLSYIDAENGTSTIAAMLEAKDKMIELIYNSKEMENSNSAGFKICAFYALKDGFDKKIGIHEEASTFGFSNLLDEVEKREWHDKFNPRFLE